MTCEGLGTLGGMCAEGKQWQEMSSFEFAVELISGVLLYWPHQSCPVSLLLCGSSGHGKSYVVCKALQRASSAQCRRVFTVAPQLSMCFLRSRPDRTTSLRKDIRRAIYDLVASNNKNADNNRCGAAVVIVLDHMEFFIAANTDAAALGDNNLLVPGQLHHTTPCHPVLLADLHDVIRGKGLFDKAELCRMGLDCVLFLTLFGGMYEDIDPFVRAKLFDAYVFLRTPIEAERLTFLQAHTTVPSCLCQAVAARSGGITYRGLAEVADHVVKIMQDVASMQEHQYLCLCSGKALDDDEHTRGCEMEALVAVISLRAVLAFGASGSVAAQEYLLKTGYVDVQETRWNHIAGLESVKETLQRAVIQPLNFYAAYRRFGIRPSTGVLLCGPPGTGKTMLARAMATELNASFVYLDLPQLMQAEVGESERRLREFFDAARERSPSVMFIDELQAAFGARHDARGTVGSTHDTRLVAQLIHLLDRAQGDEGHFTLFVGATNAKHLVDEALLRAGRLDTVVEVPFPDEPARRAMVQRVVCGEWAAWFPASEVAARQALINAFVDSTVGFSGAELRHAMNMFAFQLLCLAHTNVGCIVCKCFFSNLQDLLKSEDAHTLSTHARAALKRAIAGTTKAR